jgi:hypothetical protein
MDLDLNLLCKINESSLKLQMSGYKVDDLFQWHNQRRVYKKGCAFDRWSKAQKVISKLILLLPSRVTCLCVWECVCVNDVCLCESVCVWMMCVCVRVCVCNKRERGAGWRCRKLGMIAFQLNCFGATPLHPAIVDRVNKFWVKLRICDCDTYETKNWDISTTKSNFSYHFTWLPFNPRYC